MSHTWEEWLDQLVESLGGRLIRIRRHLHAHPERSGEERETSLYLYTQLGDEGFKVRMGPEGLGVLADYASSSGSPELGIALRCDLDALTIHDEKTVPYRSQNDGVMHACGHDVHTAVVLGTLMVLKCLDEQSSGSPSAAAGPHASDRSSSRRTITGKSCGNCRTRPDLPIQRRPPGSLPDRVPASVRPDHSSPLGLPCGPHG